jgi:aspartate oxidase
LMMVVAMHRRMESRGGHARTDFPKKVPGLARREMLTWEQARVAGRAMPYLAAAATMQA